MMLSKKACDQLLRLARASVEAAVTGAGEPTPVSLGLKLSPELEQKMGGFVTLKKRGELRGCIGEIMPQRRILDVVAAQAAHAAMNDYRFRPVTQRELGDISIEISAMTPPRLAVSWREFEVGKHGVVLHKDGRSAVFLPQVAPEQGWDAAETLTHLATKAGLPADAWREGARFELFEAQVFGE